MKKWQLVLLHVFFWFMLFFNQLPKNKSEQIEIDPLWVSFLFVNIVAFYFNYFVVVPQVVIKKRIPLAVGLVVSFFTFIVVRFFVEEILFPLLFGFGNYAEGTTLPFYILDNFYYGSSAVFISSLIWMLNFSLLKQRENELLSIEKNAAELSLLKSQINPHFIFNTLNNIYALVNMKSEKALVAIEKLGNLLRISGSEIHKDFIPLKTECNYIRNLIDLESLRFKNPQITFEENIKDSGLQIAPMLLIPFVENAFKHGNISSFPLCVSIADDEKWVYFTVKNKIFQGKKDKSTGIGINNVKKRLELIYPERHSVDVIEKDNFYEIRLKIRLK